MPLVKKTTADAEALGRSRGGFTTIVHAACDALGNPRRFILTPGQRAEITQAEALLGQDMPQAVLGDKGCDSDAFIAFVKALEAVWKSLHKGASSEIRVLRATLLAVCSMPNKPKQAAK